jgi:ectoine hydroxylase-related dioxygenase (phytanoyl-CoA dioxygenase family)
MLSQAGIEQYREQGYVVIARLFGPDEVARLHSEIERVSAGQTVARHDAARVEMEPDQPLEGTLVRRIYEPCTYYAPFRELSDSDKLLGCVEKLLGPDLEFHYSKINMKPPSIGSVVEWHQDLTYYPLTNADSVSILIYLDDADRGNGCLQVIPGRHRAQPMDHTRNGYFQGRITEPVDESQGVALEAEAGSTIFMHCLTPHASVANTSSRPRRTLILSYRASDAYPVFAGEATAAAEAHVRQVRGVKRRTARFGFTEFPVPRQRQITKSLYELQALSRREQDA